jgi:hypothetical protein
MTVPGNKRHLSFQAQNVSRFSMAAKEISIKILDSRIRQTRSSDVESDRKKFTGLYTGPYFDPKMASNVSAQLGDSALLNCNVNQIGGRTVSKIIKLHFIAKTSN